MLRCEGARTALPQICRRNRAARALPERRGPFSLPRLRHLCQITPDNPMARCPAKGPVWAGRACAARGHCGD